MATGAHAEEPTLDCRDDMVSVEPPRHSFDRRLDLQREIKHRRCTGNHRSDSGYCFTLDQLGDIPQIKLRNGGVHMVVAVYNMWYMKTPKFTNLAVFVIFFGIALIEALQKQNWLEAALFLSLGIISLWADIRKD